MPTSNDLHSRDIRSQLHPYTNAVKHRSSGPRIIERGDGIYVYDDQGNQYLEAMAGLWSVAVGFNEPRLVEAAARQMGKLPFYHTFTHKAHTPSIELAERLVNQTGGKMATAFFTNSGSEANDTVIKFVWYYNNALGRPRKKKIIARQRAYHGVTVASASLTGLPGNHRDFDLPLPQVRHVGCPHHYRNANPGETEEEFASRLAAELDAMIEQEGPDTVAAFIGEPVMGAGGVIVPPRTYWDKIQAVCRKHDVLVIADEVITGFGRLGTYFGCDAFGIEPDIMVLSKQITSSYQPLAAVLLSPKVNAVIAENSGKIGTLGHGYTPAAIPWPLPSRWKIWPSSTSAGWSRTPQPRVPCCSRNCASSPAIRWSAKCAGWALSRRWNWSPTSRASGRSTRWARRVPTPTSRPTSTG